MPLEFVELDFAEKDPGLPLLPLSTDPPELAPPKDVERVPIVFRPPSLTGADDSKVTIQLVMASPYGSSQIRRAVRSAYALYGEEGVLRVGGALPADIATFSPWHFFDSSRVELDKITASIKEPVTKAAVAYAQERLAFSRKQVPLEEQRYNAEKGDAWLTLARAMDRVETARIAWLRADKFAAAADKGRAILGPALKADPAALHADAATRHADLMALIAGLAHSAPVLYRIWDAPDVVAKLREVLASRSKDEDQEQAVRAIGDFQNLVFGALDRTREAAKNTEKHLDQDGGAMLWRYQPVILAALTRLGVPRGTVEWRAAADALERAGAATSWVSRLSFAAQALEIGLAFAAVAPPVAAAAAVLSLIMQALEWLEELWTYKEDQDAFYCCLNPAETFISEPSLTALLVGLGMILLQAHGAGKSAIEARAARLP